MREIEREKEKERESRPDQVIVYFLHYIKVTIKGNFDVTFLKKKSVSKFLWPDCNWSFEKLYGTLFLVTLVDFKRSLFDEVLRILKKHFIKQSCKVFWYFRSCQTFMKGFFSEKNYTCKKSRSEIIQKGPEYASNLCRRDQSITMYTANTAVQLTVEHSQRSKQKVTNMLSWCYIN